MPPFELSSRLDSSLRSVSYTHLLGEHPERNPEYPAIINDKHFQRLQGLIRSAGVEPSTAPDRRIAPVVLPDVCEQDPVMGEELFGPILPVLGFDRVADAVRFVKSRPRPLALYLFTKDAGVQRAVLHSVCLLYTSTRSTGRSPLSCSALRQRRRPLKKCSRLACPVSTVWVNAEPTSLKTGRLRLSPA